MDFINIPVDYAIEPSQPRLVLGGIACLQTPIVAKRGNELTCLLITKQSDIGLLWNSSFSEGDVTASVY